MSADLPRITVITPSFQQAPYLERTILSVISQNYPHLEYIIIDGGSTDGSVEIIRKYESHLTHWSSDADAGQADAINKGLAMATGSLLIWINSDDLLLPGALDSMARLHLQHPDSILLANVINFVDGQMSGQLIRQYRVTAGNLLALWNRGGYWHQPGTFVPRTYLKIAPVLDTRLHFYFDRAWLCHLLAEGAPVIYTDTVAAAFRLHPSSKTCRDAPRMGGEMKKICAQLGHVLPPGERAFAPAGLELMQANHFISPEYPLFWNRRIAWKHLVNALGHSRRTLSYGFFWRIVLKLAVPRWFTLLISQRLAAKNEKCPLPSGYT